MMIMAIDHASALIARQHASAFWAGAMSAYTGDFPFLTRWITHACAPGFLFLTAAGIYWFTAVRLERSGRHSPYRVAPLRDLPHRPAFRSAPTQLHPGGVRAHFCPT